MEKKKIFLSCPTMHGQELHYIQEAFDTNWVAPLGPNVNEFEKEFAAYLGEGYAAALSAGTGAIHLALIIAGVRRDDIVFGSSLTFAATVNPITYIGAKPVFIDSEEDSWNMDPAALEKPSFRPIFTALPEGSRKLPRSVKSMACRLSRMPRNRSAPPCMADRRDYSAISAFFPLTEIKSSRRPGEACL